MSVVALALRQDIAEHELKFSMYTGLKRETIQSLGLGNTPQTIVVSPEGEILKVWMGAYVEEMQPEVEAFLGAKLPGLTSLSNN